MSRKNPSHKNFDFDKPQKRTFDFTKDVDNNTTSWVGALRKNVCEFFDKKTWLWIFSIIVIGLLIWGIIATIRTENKTVEDENQTPTVEEVIEQPETVEEGTEVPAVSDEQLSEETSPTDVQETRPLTPIPSSTTEEPSVPVQSQPSKSSPTTTQSQSNASINVSNDVEAEAMKVIRGDYGNNPIRKKNLGPRYREIQKRVNEMKRKGEF